jgi:hypothetical protein
MIEQFQELLQAGVWLGPSVLGALSHRLLVTAGVAGSDDLAGMVMLATAALILTVAGVKLQQGKHAAIAPAAFVAMFLASWSMS